MMRSYYKHCKDDIFTPKRRNVIWTVVWMSLNFECNDGNCAKKVAMVLVGHLYTKYIQYVIVVNARYNSLIPWTTWKFVVNFFGAQNLQYSYSSYLRLQCPSSFQNDMDEHKKMELEYIQIRDPLFDDYIVLEALGLFLLGYWHFRDLGGMKICSFWFEIGFVGRI